MAVEHRKHSNEEAQRPQGKLKFTFRGNSKTDLPIMIAFLGLIYSATILQWNTGPAPGSFHDLGISNKRALMDTLLSRRTAFLQGEIQRLYPLSQIKGPDSKPLQDTLQQDRALVRRTAMQEAQLAYFNVDTSLTYFAPYFSADRDSLLAAIKNGDSLVGVQLRDTCCSMYGGLATQRGTLSISRSPKPLVDFFGKYSEFGFWFVLSIAQMSLWFMLAALVIGGVRRTNDIQDQFQYNLLYGGALTIIPTLVVGAFAVLLYFKLIHGPVILDDYFQDGFNTRMILYSVPGYLVATLCFGAYLFLANKLELLDTATANAGKTLENVKDQYGRLKTAFDFVFNSSAVILSVFVIWLGALFSAVNNLEVARLYTLSSGKPLLNYDFVYLMGMIHSLLLAIFYFPVRVQFNALQLTQDDKAPKQGVSNTTKLFKTFVDIIGGVLVTASPFITTIVQKALTGLLGG